MKKILRCSLFIIGIFFEKYSFSYRDHDVWNPFTIAFSSGYVFKNDCRFKKVYGHGAINIITTDFCYYPWQHWGFGTKVSYWRAKGNTTFLKFCTLLQEVPLTFYGRGAYNFDCGLQLYGSLGAGFIYMKEKSYLGCAKFYKGVGEAEIGLHYPIYHCLNFTTAFRYLFPPQCVNKHTQYKVDVGGCDLRAGLSFLF